MTTREANKRLSGDLKVLARDTEELLKASATATSDGLDNARHRVTRALESARANCRQLQERTKQAARTTDRVIRSHPYETIGIALGTGLLLGLLARRRH